MKACFNACMLGLLLLTVVSCGRSYVIDEEVAFAEATWTHGDTQTFELLVTDTTQRYDLFLELDHTTFYPYQNIYLNITTAYPAGAPRTQRLNVDLADPTGKWRGKCKGDNCKAQVLLQQRAYFNEYGKHRFTFEQLTRDAELLGMNGIRFRVAKSRPASK